jgi:hypothetical protein
MRCRISHALAAALAITALVGAASAAAANRIAPGRSIGSIALGDERATIGARLGGDGIVIARTPDPAHPGNRNLDAVLVAYPSLSITARFPTDEASTGATVVATRSPRYRTGAGIGVGATRAALLRAHPAAACAGRVCRLGPGAGRAVTRFLLADGRVVRVAVSSK